MTVIRDPVFFFFFPFVSFGATFNVSPNFVDSVDTLFDVTVATTSLPVFMYSFDEDNVGDNNQFFSSLTTSIEIEWGFDPEINLTPIWIFIETDFNDPQWVSECDEGSRTQCENSTAFVQSQTVTLVFDVGFSFISPSTAQSTASVLGSNLSGAVGSVFPIVLLSISVFLAFYIIQQIMFMFPNTKVPVRTNRRRKND